MHDIGASSLSLSLMATAASIPFFLFTLPAGAFGDIVNRRVVIVSAAVWQGACAALLVFGAWTQVINPNSVLAYIFVLGIGLAFGAPVWGAIVPDVVSMEELPSAITLGGVQLSLSGILGPALSGFLLPMLSAPLLISVNALTFLVVALLILQWRPRQIQSTRLRENFTESFIASLRYARNSQRMRIILFRNVLFALVISIVPALLPVIALREMYLSARPTRPCLYVRGRRVTGGSGDGTAIPPASNLGECNNFDRDGDSGRRADRDGIQSPSACFDDLYGTCGRGLGVGGGRALAGWTARDARLGARTDEFVPDSLRAGKYGARSNLMGDGSSICRSRSDLCYCGCCSRRWVGPRSSIFNQLRH
jgi:Transmembrane secretion effector